MIKQTLAHQNIIQKIITRFSCFQSCIKHCQNIWCIKKDFWTNISSMWTSEQLNHVGFWSLQIWSISVLSLKAFFPVLSGFHTVSLHVHCGCLFCPAIYRFKLEVSEWAMEIRAEKNVSDRKDCSGHHFLFWVENGLSSKLFWIQNKIFLISFWLWNKQWKHSFNSKITYWPNFPAIGTAIFLPVCQTMSGSWELKACGG